jgi:hypothetical protein
MKRCLVALALVLPLLDPLALLAKAWAAGESSCRDHACLCARRCPPKPSPAEPCHGKGGQGPAMRGTCSHDQAAALGAMSPAVLPAEARPAVLSLLDLAPGSSAGAKSTGFGEIDPPPPRAH